MNEQEYFDRITLELNGITPEVYVPKQRIDANWEALKQERLTPYQPTPSIDRIANVSLMLWANKNYSDGNLQCDVYQEGKKIAYNKNLIFSVTPEMTANQYKVWDLIATDAYLSDCQTRRAKFYEKDHAENYAIEFAHFEIWRNEKLLLAYLLVETWIIPMKIYINTYQNSGNIKLTAPWKNRIDINQWYEENI